MPPRSSWKGYLRLSLVSVPVQAISASVAGQGEIHFHQLHAKCHNRIRYKKICPQHGEVPNDEIVSGYEYAKGKYVIVDRDELASLRSESERAINVDTFIAPGELDPIYFDGRNYYLVPDTPVAQKPYAVLCQAMEREKAHAVGHCIFSGREQLVLVRPQNGLLMMDMLKFASQVRLPDTMEGEVPKTETTAHEIKLAQTLIEASTAKRFDIAAYEDHYTEQLTELIEAKVSGKKIVAPPSEEPAPVINLMDALRKSVAKTRQSAGGAKTRPAKKLSARSRNGDAHRRRKKSAG